MFWSTVTLSPLLRHVSWSSAIEKHYHYQSYAQVAPRACGPRSQRTPRATELERALGSPLLAQYGTVAPCAAPSSSYAPKTPAFSAPVPSGQWLSLLLPYKEHTRVGLNSPFPLHASGITPRALTAVQEFPLTRMRSQAPVPEVKPYAFSVHYGLFLSLLAVPVGFSHYLEQPMGPPPSSLRE